MQNIRYHALNIAAILIFSYAAASTINQIIKYNITPEYSFSLKKTRQTTESNSKKDFAYYNDIIESSFFRIADTAPAGTGPADNKPESAVLNDLTLLGTITGPTSIARALIIKKGEPNPKIFALYYVNNEINSDVYGYNLYGISSLKVYLKNDSNKFILDMYGQKEGAPVAEADQGAPTGDGSVVKKTISRAEIKQNVLNNMDNALKGLHAGPYRVNNNIEGYRIIKVRPYNILYKLGARNGDIIKRINGKSLDSTEKLYKMWDSFKNDSKIVCDIERGGKIITFEYNLSE